MRKMNPRFFSLLLMAAPLLLACGDDKEDEPVGVLSRCLEDTESYSSCDAYCESVDSTNVSLCVAPADPGFPGENMVEMVGFAAKGCTGSQVIQGSGRALFGTPFGMPVRSAKCCCAE